MSTLEVLAELQAARGLVPEPELARRAREVLNRGGMRELDVVEFLRGRGFEGPELMRAAGSFGRALADEYLAEHGVRPLKAEVFVEHLNARRMVNVYLECDRPLVERVFAGWTR
jgi:hypothetical protein